LYAAGGACCIGHEAGTFCASNQKRAFERRRALRVPSLLLLRPAEEPISRMNSAFAASPRRPEPFLAERSALR
jgi:hypothetical protein